MYRHVGYVVAALIAGLVAISTFSSHAQVNPFRDQLSDLSPEDLDKLRRAAIALYENPDVPIGTIERWENPISGNSGAVRLLSTFEHMDLPCKTLQHRIDLANAAEPQFFVINRCLTEDGSWRIL